VFGPLQLTSQWLDIAKTGWMMSFLKRLLPKRFRKKGTTIPVVRLHGTIMAGGSQFKQTLNIASVAPMLDKAFSKKDAPVVAISINSPGGSPVQSRLIFQRIRSLAEEKDKKVLIFVEDVAASGGYMIALAGDEIFADLTSIVGSIGVVSGGFGFPELLRKIGVERRVYTAGENKAILDPFQPEKEGDIEYLKTLQLEIHKVFIDMVKLRRGSRLAEDATIFSGLFWTGTRGLDLGLIDGLGDMRDVLKRRYGKDTKLELIGGTRTLFGKRVPGVSLVGINGGEIAAAATVGLAEGLEERALWSRYGL
jgi:signal peptide peptidase SppA